MKANESNQKYTCLDCIHFKCKETVVDGKIEHKLPNGTVWMIEPNYKEIPMHCPLHPEYFNEWWEKNKHLCRVDKEFEEPDCEDFDLPEFNKNLRKLINDAEIILAKMK